MSFRDIDEMSLPEYGLLQEYWADNPPTHLLVAAFMGVKKRTKPNNDMLNLPPGMSTALTENGMKILQKLDQPKLGAVYDFETLKANALAKKAA